MVEILEEPEVGALTLAPKNPLPYWQQLKALRSYIDGVQALVDAGRELGLDPGVVNVNGGSIAIGHPLGCSGVRISTTLIHEMARRSSTLRYGLATMCVGVGQGAAVVYEKL